MTSLLDRLTRLSYNDERRHEVTDFARVLGNYFTSVEAPGRMQGEFSAVSVECTSLSQGDECFANAGHKNKKTRTRTGRETGFENLRPAQLVNQLQSL